MRQSNAIVEEALVFCEFSSFDQYEQHVDLCNVRLAGQPAGRLSWQNLLSWILHANFSNNLFILAKHVGIIDFCCFIPHSLILTLPWVTRSAQRKPRMDPFNELRSSCI